MGSVSKDELYVMDEILKCTNLMKSKLSEIQEIGVRNDWSNDSVRNATKRCDDIVEKCW